MDAPRGYSVQRGAKSPGRFVHSFLPPKLDFSVAGTRRFVAPLRATQAASVLLALVLLCACGRRPVQLSLNGEAMGTTYSVKLVPLQTLSSEQEAQLARDVSDAIAEVNSLMSTYDPASELSRFNASRSTEAFPVSPPTLANFLEARRIGAASGGAFDITVGPLVNAWGFGPDRTRRSPAEQEITELRAQVGWDKLEIDPSGSLRKLTPSLYCDLSAIAKGYAVDRVSELLSELGYTRHMVEIGGEVRALGTNEAGLLWRIAVEAPRPGGRSFARVLPLENLALATSGDYRNFYEQDGKRLSHTIDPRTGRPVEHNLGAVSVVHPSCMTADAWATALNVLGENEGYRVAVEQGLSALFQVRQADGSYQELATPAFTGFFGETATLD